MKQKTSLSRRQFIARLSTLSATAPLILPSGLRAASSNGRLALGFIGLGKKGREHLKDFLKLSEVQVVALAEVSTVRRDSALEMVHTAYARQKESGAYKGCAAYNDFRELLARKDIDAVVIATPDHWHALPAILAAKAKKDIYCEKPLSVAIGEARAMVNAVRKHNVIFQTGSQQRTEFGGRFRLACELVRSGRLGRLTTVRVGVGDPNRPCDLPTEPVPEGVDWNLWLGPAPERGFNQILCPLEVHDFFPHWRDYREYAGGKLADMGAHHFDIAQWALDMDHSGPVEVHPPEGGALTGLKFVYQNGVEMFHGGPSGCTFEGTEGTIYVDRGKIESTPESILKEPLGTKDVHLENLGDSHKKIWLASIKSRRKPNVDVEIGARSATVCHLGNLGYQLRRKLKWDPKKEQFAGDTEANKLIHRAYRAPWKLA